MVPAGGLISNLVDDLKRMIQVYHQTTEEPPNPFEADLLGRCCWLGITEYFDRGGDVAA